MRHLATLFFFLLVACTTTRSSSGEAARGGTPTVLLPSVMDNRPAPYWRPPVTATLQIQYTGDPIDLSVGADIYDLDVSVDASLVADLHGRGKKVLCYINAGAWEEWRPDAGSFPPEVIGADYAGWPGEKWLDIRRLDLLAPIMGARLDECKAKGFDGVDPDNINGYQNPTGFPLTYQDQIAYNTRIADEAHARGLAVGQKNGSGMVGDLLPSFDYAVLESCFLFDECDAFLPFVAAGKPVFAVEYTDLGMTTDRFCSRANGMNVSAMLKHVSLDAFREACR